MNWCWKKRSTGALELRRPQLSVSNCPPDTCPICGQHDPDELADGCHPSCVEWLGWTPRRPIGGISSAEAVNRLQRALLEVPPGFRFTPTRGGHASGPLTVHDLPAPPAWVVQPPPPQVDRQLIGYLEQDQLPEA